jgi:hypothetical protein
MEVMSKQIVSQFGFADTQFNDNDDQPRLVNSESIEKYHGVSLAL